MLMIMRNGSKRRAQSRVWTEEDEKRERRHMRIFLTISGIILIALLIFRYLSPEPICHNPQSIDSVCQTSTGATYNCVETICENYDKAR